MYIIKNAFLSISRNKGRNLLISVIALVIAISACVSLSIREAAVTAREDTLGSLSVTATISVDRAAMMQGMSQDSASDASGGRGKFDMSAIASNTLTLSDYMKYTDALTDDDSYYYTISASLNASGELEAYSTSSTDASDESSATADSGMSDAGGMFGGKGGMTFTAQGDFSLTGYSDYNAMMSLFGADGTCEITDGTMFAESTEDMVCVISYELALYNDISVGDTITLANPNFEDETYTFTVCGIYTDSASDSGSSMFSRSDPANNIYMSYNTLNAVLTGSSEAGNTYTDTSGAEQSAALVSEPQFTYVFADADNYYAFEEKVREIGLDNTYTVSSSDLAAFESSLAPLDTLSKTAGWFFVVVLAVGGIILVVINIFNLRERKYEVGVLTAIGMKKSKVAIQFMFELLCVTFAAMIIGTAGGAAVSVPVTNALLAGQIESTESENEDLAGNFGMSRDDFGASSFGNKQNGQMNSDISYVSSVTDATDMTVILQLIAVGVLLTLISSLAAMITIMRYEPLKILSDRS